MKELINIQQELNAPKSLRNNFGNYNYRSAETILEAVKPLLKTNNCLLLLSDEIIREDNRFYIKATARLINEEGKEISVTGYAREEETKKGMDCSQITGTSSSYARKYALNGLFAIDDEKDSDATNDGKKTEEKQEKKWFNLKKGDLDKISLKIADSGKTSKDYIDGLKKAGYSLGKETEEKILAL